MRILLVGWICFSFFPVKNIHNFLKDDKAFKVRKTLKGERGFEEKRKCGGGGGGKFQNQATADFAQTGANFSPCFKIAENCETTNPPDSVKRTSEHCNLPGLNIFQRDASASQKAFSIGHQFYS